MSNFDIDAHNESATRPSRKGLAFGLTAGLVGGTVAGMAFGVPGLTSAAADGDGVAAPAALVQVDDETGDIEVDEPAERGDRVREVLQPLVTDGTITSDQADSVATHLVENRPERGGHGRDGHGRRGHGGFGRGVASEVVTDLLGIDAPTLRTELRDGATLAELAEANGVETSAVIDALVAEAEERVNAAVEAGRVDADEAAERLAQIEERVTAKVNGENATDG